MQQSAKDRRVMEEITSKGIRQYRKNTNSHVTIITINKCLHRYTVTHIMDRIGIGFRGVLEAANRILYGISELIRLARFTTAVGQYHLLCSHPKTSYDSNSYMCGSCVLSLGVCSGTGGIAVT